MRRPLLLATLVVAAGLAAIALARQLTVPDIESAQKRLASGFDELERLGAYVVASDGEFLGRISRGFGSDSLGNRFGKGSRFASKGLFNPYSPYGSRFSSKSAFSSTASEPPEILVRQGGTTYSVGLLTTNPVASTRGQRIDPRYLRTWLGLDQD